MLGDTPKALKRRHRVKDVNAAGRLWKHSTLADIAGLVTPEQIAQARIFTMVRNPWDRVVSYYHWLQGQSFDHPAVGLAKDLTFSAFLNHPQIMASLGLRIAPLGHDNRSKREKSYAFYYSEEDQHLVGDLLRDDIIRFGYKFG